MQMKDKLRICADEKERRDGGADGPYIYVFAYERYCAFEKCVLCGGKLYCYENNSAGKGS